MDLENRTSLPVASAGVRKRIRQNDVMDNLIFLWADHGHPSIAPDTIFFSSASTSPRFLTAAWKTRQRNGFNIPVGQGTNFCFR
ncbi:MAG TPA: hypothetical protein VN043_14380, partial [Rhodanobacter sp.]|nr:hypothetical protein [Rhodanobacter sp.]